MSFTLWFTGLSGAGKTTLSRFAYEELLATGATVELLDGDWVRSHLGGATGFDRHSRYLNIRTLGLLSMMLNRHGIISIVAAIAPLAEARSQNRLLIQRYYEVYCDCTLSVLEQRDPKGLYRRARRGEIEEFTGISSPYDIPEVPEIHLRTEQDSVEQTQMKLKAELVALGLLPD